MPSDIKIDITSLPCNKASGTLQHNVLATFVNFDCQVDFVKKVFDEMLFLYFLTWFRHVFLNIKLLNILGWQRQLPQSRIGGIRALSYHRWQIRPKGGKCLFSAIHDLLYRVPIFCYITINTCIHILYISPFD